MFVVKGPLSRRRAGVGAAAALRVSTAGSMRPSVRRQVDAPMPHRQQPREPHGTPSPAIRGHTPTLRRRADPPRGAVDRSRLPRRSEPDPRRPDGRRVCEPDARASHLITVGRRAAIPDTGLLAPVHRKPFLPRSTPRREERSRTCPNEARHGPVGAAEVLCSANALTVTARMSNERSRVNGRRPGCPRCARRHLFSRRPSHCAAARRSFFHVVDQQRAQGGTRDSDTSRPDAGRVRCPSAEWRDDTLDMSTAWFVTLVPASRIRNAKPPRLSAHRERGTSLASADRS